MNKEMEKEMLMHDFMAIHVETLHKLCMVSKKYGIDFKEVIDHFSNIFVKSKDSMAKMVYLSELLNLNSIKIFEECLKCMREAEKEKRESEKIGDEEKDVEFFNKLMEDAVKELRENERREQ